MSHGQSAICRDTCLIGSTLKMQSNQLLLQGKLTTDVIDKYNMQSEYCPSLVTLCCEGKKMLVKD